MHSQTELAARFGAVDYAVFAIMLAISMCIGLYYACSGNRQQTAKAFLMADRSMGVAPVSLSLFASFISAPAILGIPVEVYTYGSSYWVMTLSFFVVLPVSAYLYMPVFYDLGLTSSYEYLERRFNKLIRKFSSAIFILNMVMFLAMVTYVPAVALSQVTGMHVWTSVSAIGVVCTIYTTMGGMKAVMWTDAVQIFVMIFSMAAVAIKGASMLGGFTNVWLTSYNGGRLNAFNFDPNPLERHTFWCLTVGAAIMWLSVYGVNQTQVQRYLTAPSKRTASLAIWLNLPAQFIFISLGIVIGMIVYTKYSTCDPLSVNLVQAKIQMLPLFVMESMSDMPGLPGLFVAGLFSASLSTLSSGLNSLAAVTLEDFVKPLCYPKLSERQAGFVSKFIAFIYGIIALGLIAVVEQLGNILEAVFSLFGMISAPLFGLFTLGMFFPCTNCKGAGIGFISGLSLVLWIGIGAQVTKPMIPEFPVFVTDCNATRPLTTVLAQNVTSMQKRTENYTIYNLSYLWYSTIGFVTVIVVGLIVSYLTTFQKIEEIDINLLSPPIRRFYAKRSETNVVGQTTIINVGQTKTSVGFFSKFRESSKHHLSTMFAPESDVSNKSVKLDVTDDDIERVDAKLISPEERSTDGTAATAF